MGEECVCLISNSEQNWEGCLGVRRREDIANFREEEKLGRSENSNTMDTFENKLPMFLRQQNPREIKMLRMVLGPNSFQNLAQEERDVQVYIKSP